MTLVTKVKLAAAALVFIYLLAHALPALIFTLLWR
jgi:hypothetical protein